METVDLQECKLELSYVHTECLFLPACIYDRELLEHKAIRGLKEDLDQMDQEERM